MLLEVILRKNGSIFNHRHLLLHFLEGNVIIYHVIAYDPKSEKMSDNYILVAMATNFYNLRSFLEKILKYPKTVWQFFINSNNKKRTSFN